MTATVVTPLAPCTESVEPEMPARVPLANGGALDDGADGAEGDVAAAIGCAAIASTATTSANVIVNRRNMVIPLLGSFVIG